MTGAFFYSLHVESTCAMLCHGQGKTDVKTTKLKSLTGSEDGGHEKFHEFFSEENNPLTFLDEKFKRESLRAAMSQLDERELSLPASRKNDIL